MLCTAVCVSHAGRRAPSVRQRWSGFNPGYFWPWGKAGVTGLIQGLTEHELTRRISALCVGRRHTALQTGKLLFFFLFLPLWRMRTRHKMDLNFYSDLTDGTGQPGDTEFLDAQAFNGFDPVQKVISAVCNPLKQGLCSSLTTRDPFSCLITSTCIHSKNKYM